MSRYFILIALLAGAFACAESGGGLAEGGIGGSGISQGPITEFGSIFVNGIEWELDGAEVEIDGVPPETVRVSDDDLTALFNLGMVVRVKGTIDSSTGIGQAERVFFDDEIEGPVSVLGPEMGVLVPFREFMVLGQRVRIEAGVTRFKGLVGGGPDFGFDTIVDDDVVEISGLIDVDGVVRATYVEQKGKFDPDQPDQTEVELKGTVSGLVTLETFMLGSVRVEFDNAELPERVVKNGDVVEVKGTLSGADVITATKIELEDDFGDDDVDEFSTTGFVNGCMEASICGAVFLVGNQQVDASGEIKFEHGNASMLVNGSRIEVEGELILGTLIAEEIEFEDREVRVHAAFANNEGDINLVAGSFKLLGIEIQVIPSTRIEFGLGTLAEDDFLEVRGIVNAQGVITASRVVNKGPRPSDKIRLDGPVEQIDETTDQFTILGVTVLTPTNAKFFFDTPGAPPEPTERLCFFENLNEGDFVNVKGINGSNIDMLEAEEVELKKEEIPVCGG